MCVLCADQYLLFWVLTWLYIHIIHTHIYLFIHLVTHVTLDTSNTVCNLYIITQLIIYGHPPNISISNHICKISSGLFSSLLTVLQNQSQNCILLTQSASWRFWTVIMCMVSNEAIFWLHVLMNFYTQSWIICLNF